MAARTVLVKARTVLAKATVGGRLAASASTTKTLRAVVARH